MRPARSSARDPRCRPIFAHLRKPIPFALRKGVMLRASGTRKISQPRSKDSKARQAGPMQSDLQRNAVDLCAVDGGARWRSHAKCPQAPGFQTWPPCLESCSFGALHRRRWAPTNPGSIAAVTEIRRASGVAGTTIANLPVRSRLPGRVGSSAARNSSRSTRPRQVRTERSGSAAGPITHAVVYSDRHPARSAMALRQDQTDFSKIS